MRPKRHETTGSSDLFRARLDQITNMKHALAQHRSRCHPAIGHDNIGDQVTADDASAEQPSRQAGIEAGDVFSRP